MAVHVTVHTVCACAQALCKLLLLIHCVPAQWKNAEDTARRISRTKRHNPGPLSVMCDPCCLAYFVEALRSFQNSHTWGFLFILSVQQRSVMLCCWSLAKKSGTSSRDLCTSSVMWHASPKWLRRGNGNMLLHPLPFQISY